MKVLVIGRGGREHAIALKLKQSKHVDQVYIAPGNSGMKDIGKIINIEETDKTALVTFAYQNQIDFTIVGPENALSCGIVDVFENHGLKIFGPRKNAAIIEGSKEFAKDLMKKYKIPTSDYQSFDDYNGALHYVQKQGVPIVIKYDGLAGGKGVVVATTLEMAQEALKEMLLDKKYGNARVVIEEFLAGPEFSFMCFVNEEKVYPMVIAQDHKRAFDHDMGPNTGGMGAYSPVPIIKDCFIEMALEKIMKPTALAMIQEGRPYIGVLYGGLILTKDGPKVIEFNARFGDPETEVVLPRMESDFMEVLLAVLEKKEYTISWSDEVTLGVVLASKGYPNIYEKGNIIEGLESINAPVFHMGTDFKENHYICNGGRVLFVVGKGKTFIEAQKNAYEEINKIKCDSLFYRKDIGYQVIK